MSEFWTYEFLAVDKALAAETKPVAYDQAARLLIDIRELAARGGTEETFQRRLANLRAKNSRKSSFLKRIESALDPEQPSPRLRGRSG